MITTLGLTLALAAAILFAIYGLLSRVLSVKSDDPLAFSVIYGFFSAIISIFVFGMGTAGFAGVTAFVVLITFLSTIAYGVFEATQFFARKYVEASRSTVIFQIAPVVTFFASIILLREGISLVKLLAAGLIVVGNIIALYRHGGRVSKSGLILTISAAVALGLAYVADKVASPNYPLGLYMAITYFLPALYVLIIFLALRQNRISRLKNEITNGTWKLPFLSAVSVAGYYMLLKTLGVAQASVAVPIIFSQTILVVLGGIFILKERSNIFEKVIGALLVFVGVVLLH